VTDSDSDRLRKFLHAKIAKRKKQIHPAHNPRFNHDMQLEIDCIESFIEHHKYYRMLNNYSVLMMLLVVTASLVGISSIYQYVKGQGSPAATPQPQQQAQKAKSVTGNVILVTIYTSSDGKACLAEVRLPSDRPNNLGIRPGGA